MKQAYWNMIREDMRNTRSLRDDCLREIRQSSKEVTREYKQKLKKIQSDGYDYSGYQQNEVEKRYSNNMYRIQQNIVNQYHNDQAYYLIYRDGSEAWISAEEILLGEKFPKISNVVYAEMISGDDHVDTETGELDWYSDAVLEKFNDDYDAADADRNDYETKIQFKYGTEWARNHPELNPFAADIESSLVFI